MALRVFLLLLVLSGCATSRRQFDTQFVDDKNYLSTEHQDAYHFYSVHRVIRLAEAEQEAELWTKPYALLETVAEIAVCSSEETPEKAWTEKRDWEHFGELSDVARRLGGEYFAVIGSRGSRREGWCVDALALRRPKSSGSAPVGVQSPP